MIARPFARTMPMNPSYSELGNDYEPTTARQRVNEFGKNGLASSADLPAAAASVFTRLTH